MKKIVLLLMGLVVAIGVSAQGRCKGFVYDTDGYVNVRKGMSSSSDIVRQMDNNQALYYSMTGTNWYQVSLTPAGKAIGYVYWNRISVSGEDLLTYVVTDADGYTNVRKGASTKTAIVKTMNKGKEFIGTPVYVGGKQSHWIGVLDENQRLIGFVYDTKVKTVD